MGSNLTFGIQKTTGGLGAFFRASKYLTVVGEIQCSIVRYCSASEVAARGVAAESRSF